MVRIYNTYIHDTHIHAHA